MTPRAATLIPGDGIGPEVVDAAVRVMEAAGARIAWDVQLAGKAAFEKLGTPIPEPLIASIRRTRVALKGPLETQVGRVGYRSVNVALRKTFDLYANVRPIKSLPGVRTAFSDVDLVVVRESTEDLYSGIEHQIAPGVVESVKVITARASRRIARFAFELARREHRRGVVAIHKANIMKLSDGLFLDSAPHRGGLPRYRTQGDHRRQLLYATRYEAAAVRCTSAGKSLWRYHFRPVRGIGRRARPRPRRQSRR